MHAHTMSLIHPQNIAGPGRYMVPGQQRATMEVVLSESVVWHTVELLKTKHAAILQKRSE